jgi:mono/diheme cytochrome c family protein
MDLRWAAHHRRLFIVAVFFFGGLVATLALEKRLRHAHSGRRRALAAAVEGARDLYTNHVRPLLAARCERCHGPKRQSGGFRVDTVAALLWGGDSGPAIVAKNPKASLLLTRVLAGTMPRGGNPLTAEEVGILRRWINLGAGGPPEEKRLSDDSNTSHWAFRPPSLPAIPAADPSFVRNPIDAFIAAGWKKAGLTAHNPPAGLRLLLRRVSLDLTGLPPAESEYQQFLSDPSPQAYEHAVERLLASPRYAERWARHWMDILRYASHDGRFGVKDGKKFFKEITYGSEYLWRWRDYLIEAIATDRGFDRMILEMLAGDELAPHDARVLAATGYLARNFNCRDRDLWLSQTVDHTAQAFLGLTVGCARCHNHKFDPISQKEYYQLRAFFELHDIKTDPGRQLAHARDGEERPTYLYRRGNPKLPDKRRRVEAQIPAALGRIAPCTPVAHSLGGHGCASSGRRLALARWLVSDENPLVARVAVNHIWLRHFGRALVETPAEFGVRGRPPTHPELLDWLAVEFRNHGWSMKWLHRLIVTSNAYRMSSTNRGMTACLKADPHNRLYWRGPSRRAEAEVVRDAVLHLAAKLDSNVGGPDEDHSVAEVSGRRSLYLRSSRVDRALFLETFDAPRVEECYQRTQSIVPQQGLALLNSAFVWRHAGHVAGRLNGHADFVDGAFKLVLGRAPSAAEADLCRGFLADQQQLLRTAKAADPENRARTYLVHSLLNHNDFITIR